jgi:hypothetical protein
VAVHEPGPVLDFVEGVDALGLGPEGRFAHVLEDVAEAIVEIGELEGRGLFVHIQERLIHQHRVVGVELLPLGRHRQKEQERQPRVHRAPLKMTDRR